MLSVSRREESLKSEWMEATREGRNLYSSLMAKCCTDSSEWEREGEDGSQITAQYSSMV